jgi:energy-coupling factor transporter ATP-binding protein EcfA2
MLHNVTSRRYQAAYREDEVCLIVNSARRGDSLGFVGVAGVGKSNLINFLRDIHYHTSRKEQDVENLHFPVVDVPAWNGEASSLWKMMLKALTETTLDLGQPPQNSNTISILEEERALDGLRSQLRWTCQGLKHKVMFVLDDADAIFEAGSPEMLERLNSLRSEGNRDYLSYLVFTKRLPHVLLRSRGVKDRSKFYDLVKLNLYALEPYRQKDARQMLEHLNRDKSSRLNSRSLSQILALTGGHASLMKVVFDTWRREPPTDDDVIAYFLSKPDVRRECERIFSNLHKQEQEVALLVAAGQHTVNHKDTVDHLIRRGLLSDSLAWFSPLFARFLALRRGEEG